MEKNGRTFIHQRHIQKGLEKYQAQLDESLREVLAASDWNYTPYLLRDGRIMLVYENELYALLYENRQALFRHLEEDRPE